jgi:hypothetical protein
MKVGTRPPQARGLCPQMLGLSGKSLGACEKSFPVQRHVIRNMVGEPILFLRLHFDSKINIQHLG